MLWSHVDPNMSREQMLDRMADITLEQIDPWLKAKRAEKRNEKAQCARPTPRDRSNLLSKPDSRLDANRNSRADFEQRTVSFDHEVVGELERNANDEKSLRTSEAKSNRLVERNQNNPRQEKLSRSVASTANHETQLQNDGKGCDFISQLTGKRCGSRFLLQRDHIKPFSEGGSSKAHNLRSYCGAHNRWAWRKSHNASG